MATLAVSMTVLTREPLFICGASLSSSVRYEVMKETVTLMPIGYQMVGVGGLCYVLVIGGKDEAGAVIPVYTSR